MAEPDGVTAEFDADYVARVTAACFDAIVAASTDPASGRAVLRNGEVCQALLNLAAMMLATSQGWAEPGRVQVLADDFALNLMRRAAEARAIVGRGVKG